MIRDGDGIGDGIEPELTVDDIEGGGLEMQYENLNNL